LKKTQSLRLRLTAGVAVVLALALTVCCVWMVHASGRVIESAVVTLTAQEEKTLLDRVKTQMGKLSADREDALLYAFRVLSAQSEAGSEYVLQRGEEEIFNNSGISPQALFQARGKTMALELMELTYALWEQGERALCAVGQEYRYAGDKYTVSVVKDVTQQMDQVRRLRASCVLIGVVVILAGATVSFAFLSRKLLPLGVLRRSAQEIASGNYAQRIRVESRDEVGAVAESFNTMAEAVQCRVAQVEKTAQERNLLLHALAHELRTPVTAISGYAYALTHMRLSAEQQGEALAFVESESRRLERLSTKLTELITVTDAPISLEPLSAEALQGKIQAILAPMARENGIRLITDMERGTLAGDEDLLVMLITNLYDNARKAGAKTVTVRLKAGALSVEDDGRGIPEELREKIMQPFFQGDASRNQEGFGLGLALCRRIAQVHGSELTVTGAPGAGSTFTTLLQLHDDSKTDLGV